MLKLALRNVFRQKSHTIMTLAAITAGVAGLILAGGWVNDIFVDTIRSSDSFPVRAYAGL